MTMIIFLFIFCIISSGIDEDDNFGVSAEEIPCNYTSQSKCGDAEICIHNSLNCYCKDNEINILNSDLYCCVPPPNNEPWCFSEYSFYNGWSSKCREAGEIISKTLPCEGECYNDYKINYNMTLGPHSMFQCENGDKCVRVSAMCRGYTLCSDKSDLKECDTNLKCTTNTWSSSTPHSLGSGHHYCQYHETDNDGKYTITSDAQMKIHSM